MSVNFESKFSSQNFFQTMNQRIQWFGFWKKFWLENLFSIFTYIQYFIDRLPKKLFWYLTWRSEATNTCCCWWLRRVQRLPWPCNGEPQRCPRQYSLPWWRRWWLSRATARSTRARRCPISSFENSLELEVFHPEKCLCPKHLWDGLTKHTI